MNDHCPISNLFAQRETSWAFDSHSFSLSLDPHEMSLKIDRKTIRPVKFSGVSPNLNSNCLTSWLSRNVLNPGKIFHSNSMSSPSILSKFLYSGELLNHPHLSSHAPFDWRFSFIFPRHSTEYENTWTFVRWRLMTCSSPIKDKYFHEESSQLIVFSIDLIWLFGHQFFRYVEHLFHCEIFCFWWNANVWVILPMDTDACNVEDINIHHITECLSLSFVACIEDCFCLFRTWSFTLCKNDVDLNDKSDSVSSFQWRNVREKRVWDVCAPPWGQTTGLPVLSSINSSDFHSWEDQVLSIFHSEQLDECAFSTSRWRSWLVWRQTTGFPILSYTSACALRGLWLVCFSPGFLMQ